MGKIVAIGGVTPPLSLDLIDNEIIRLTGKKNPRLLYIPAAGGDDLNYCERSRGIYEGKFGCRMDVLFLVRETPTENEIREKVFSSDIIYVEGGSEYKLMNCFKNYNMYKILKEAYEKDIVLAGKSAGAVCWGKYYFENDNDEDFKIEGFIDYSLVNCLNFLEFVFCPHFNFEGRNEKLNAMIKSDILGIGIDNDCAVEFIDDNYRVVVSRDDANAYKMYKKGTEVIKETIIKDIKFRSLDELKEVR